MKTIELTKGKVALVDDTDYPLLSKFRWHAVQSGSNWYAQRTDWGPGRRRTIRMHREVLSTPSGVHVDHISGDSLDNRRANLRGATHSQNLANRGAQCNNTSGFKGACWDRGAWKSSIQFQGTCIHLGRYPTPEEAARAYDTKARELFGPFARTNFPADLRVNRRRTA